MKAQTGTEEKETCSMHGNMLSIRMFQYILGGLLSALAIIATLGAKSIEAELEEVKARMSEERRDRKSSSAEWKQEIRALRQEIREEFRLLRKDRAP